MPTQTFFNLPKDKQKRLLDAAATEFSRVPLKDASINNIIKLAEISRGSFYQYFEDKEDLYYYFFQTLRHDTKKILEDCFKKADGDLFVAFDAFFPMILTMITEEQHSEFFRHLFVHMDYRSSRKVSPETMQQQKCEHAKKNGHFFEDYVDTDLLKIGDEDVHLLVKLIMSFLFQTIGEGFVKDWPKEKMLEVFDKKLSWVRYGVAVKE